jgi:hypothetical protein
MQEVVTSDVEKAKAQKRKRAVKNTGEWVADVPGVELAGEFFVDPPEEGQASAGALPRGASAEAICHHHHVNLS